MRPEGLDLPPMPSGEAIRDAAEMLSRSDEGLCPWCTQKCFDEEGRSTCWEYRQ